MKKLLMTACLLLAAVSPCSMAEMLIEEYFSGSASDPDWISDMISGVGGVSFEAGSPGYAHYLLDGPGSSVSYHNAELYQHIERIPPYCDFEVRLRNSNNCGFDAPGWQTEPDPLYGMGSRGWGLWNFSTDPTVMPINVIWFYCLSPESDDAFRGRGLWIVRDNIIVLRQELEIDLTQWHTYRILWRPDYIGVFIDDMDTPVAEITDPGQIPDVGMTYTTWIDNYMLTGSSIHDMEISWLPVPDFEQFIDVDYIKVHTAPSISADLICQPSSGIVPFSAGMTVSLNNDYSGQYRRLAARIDLTRGDGGRLVNWRSGTTVLPAGDSFTLHWNQLFPAFASLIGDCVFHLVAEDITSAPYNQPPYPPAGDTAESICTVTAMAP